MSTAEQLQIGELKAMIAKQAAQIDFIMKHLGITYTYDPSINDDPRVVAALRTGGLMEAIKVYREINNAGLAEAKAAVEELQGRLG